MSQRALDKVKKMSADLTKEDRVQIEEDIDDGWFTTIDKQQWVGSVFKREKIHEDDDATDEIIAKYVSLCKHRIREFKRICQYYAVAEARDANSMDHAGF